MALPISRHQLSIHLWHGNIYGLRAAKLRLCSQTLNGGRPYTWRPACVCTMFVVACEE